MHVFQVSKLANQSELQKTLDKMRDEQDMEFFFIEMRHPKTLKTSNGGPPAKENHDTKALIFRAFRRRSFYYPIRYSNLPLEYALWTWAVGAYLVGSCVLCSFRFLDPLNWWIATGNRWNLRQCAWPELSNVESLQSWASRMHQASGS